MLIDFVFIFVGLLFLIPLLSLAKSLRKSKLAWAVPRAIEIAKSHGWVSAGRLMAQANITEKDAKDALVEASRQGLLFQAEDGRYYLKTLESAAIGQFSIPSPPPAEAQRAVSKSKGA